MQYVHIWSATKLVPATRGLQGPKLEALNSVCAAGRKPCDRFPSIPNGWLEGEGNAIHLAAVPGAAPFTLWLHPTRKPSENGPHFAQDKRTDQM